MLRGDSNEGEILLIDDESLSQQESSNPDIAVTPDALMYILYTSGSTGTPKGVCRVHRATVNRCIWMWNHYPFTENEVCCHKTTLNFVDSVWEIFGALLKGVKIVVLPRSSSVNPQEMIDFLYQAKVTRIILVPSLLQILLNTPPDLGQAHEECDRAKILRTGYEARVLIADEHNRCQKFFYQTLNPSQGKLLFNSEATETLPSPN